MSWKDITITLSVGLLVVLTVFVALVQFGERHLMPPHPSQPRYGAPSGATTAAPPEDPRTIALKKMDRRLTRLARSNLAFNAPEQMQLGETNTIKLSLSPSASVGELTQRLRETGAIGRIESAKQIITAKRMQARLTGQDFKIEATSPETQAITFTQPTDWTWDVEPTEGASTRSFT
jgi:hypothetical protein